LRGMISRLSPFTGSIYQQGTYSSEHHVPCGASVCRDRHINRHVALIHGRPAGNGFYPAFSFEVISLPSATVP
jgi:hypothetical protein